MWARPFPLNGQARISFLSTKTGADPGYQHSYLIFLSRAKIKDVRFPNILAQSYTVSGMNKPGAVPLALIRSIAQKLEAY